MKIVYISLTGNTTNFVKKLSSYLKEEYDIDVDALNIKTLMHAEFAIGEPFYAIVPTYLEGGNGVDNGDVEILTTPLRSFIASNGNAEQLIGVVGAGNKNFNKQYCLTAKQYSQQFGRPVLADFELRGTDEDVEKIAKIFIENYPLAEIVSS